ncbi:MAG: glutamine--fructose-6-phosphate transaminase (isomerizing) [Lachnospiraceae bacterium]|nr:glutamine--fructose-6-phosphate transaminase (isomerizing) [Lachnospiraceae bacterium]
MCGIVGYTGPLNAGEVLLNGLSLLEYRGYDSAGIALFDDQDISVYKQIGKVKELKDRCADITDVSHCGIGHTRWATHGGVTNVNAHPHKVGKVTLIHNGIIENYHDLMERYKLASALVSDTDTEVAARVIEHYYQELQDPKAAIWKTVSELRGTFAFCVLFEDVPGVIYCIRRTSPLIAAATPNGAFAASDVTALLEYTREFFVLPEDTLAVLCPEGAFLEDAAGNAVAPEMLTVDWDVESAKKGGYPWFMLKEINEQPRALQDTLLPRIENGLPDFTEEQIPDDFLKRCKQVCIVACGTAMYAGMVAKALIEPLLRIPVSVHVASEFHFSNPLVDDDTLMLVISQSGETIDTLDALRLGKEMGATIVSVVNVKGSTIARESDYVLYTHAGPEQAVASTKAYTVQIATLYLLGCRMAMVRGKMSEEDAREFVQNLLQASEYEQQVIEENNDAIQEIARHIIQFDDAYFIGRGLDYSFSLEGALKLKEISYIHAEAYAAGELKHGTIALIEEGTPVIAIATQEPVYRELLSNAIEVKSRGAYVILITKKGAHAPKKAYDVQLTIPDVDDRFTGFPTAVCLQLLAYHASNEKGLDVDKPRNLAKSVTVR